MARVVLLMEYSPTLVGVVRRGHVAFRKAVAKGRLDRIARSTKHLAVAEKVVIGVASVYRIAKAARESTGNLKG